MKLHNAADLTGRLTIADRIVLRTRGKKKIYVAEFSEHGQHRRLSLKTSNKSVAIEKATKLAATLIDGTFKPTITPVSVEEVSERYLSYLITEGRAKKTIEKYSGTLDLFLDFLRRNKVHHIGQLMPGHFDRHRANRKTSTSEFTLFTEGVILKMFTRWAKTRRLVHEDPFAEIKLKKPLRKPKPVLTLDDIHAILARAEGPLRAILAVLAFTGMRSGELQRLRPEDVNLTDNWIHIVSREGAETKSRRSRQVPTHPCLRPFLKDLETRHRPWLFTALSKRPDSPKDRPIDCDRLNVRFQSIIRQLGLTAGRKAGFVIHSLRHFFETFTVNSNIPQRVIDAWLGHHSDVSMGAVYYHLSDEESQRFMSTVPFSWQSNMSAITSESNVTDTTS